MCIRDRVQQNFHALVHLFGCDALTRAVEVEAAGTQVRAGQAHIAQGRAVGAAAYRRLDRLQPGSTDGLAGILHQVEMCIRDSLFYIDAVFTVGADSLSARGKTSLWEGGGPKGRRERASPGPEASDETNALSPLSLIHI